MFSTGQLIFAAIFFLGFLAAMIYSYRKDVTLHKKYYNGSIYVLVGFIVFIVILFFLKQYLRP